MRVFASTGFPECDLHALAGAATITFSEDLLTAAKAHARDVVALIPTGRYRIDASVLADFPALRIVASPARGSDHIDLDACRARNVIVTNSGRATAEATADLTFALLLTAARRVGEGERIVRRGEWRGFAPDFMLGRRVFRMRLGLLGCGHIGQAVARRARGFGMQVFYTQRTRHPEALERAMGLTYAPSLDAMLPELDVLSLHAPLTPTTRGILSQERIAALPRGSIVVNTSRGQLVDEQALTRALASGHLFSAGLDVFEAEPHVSADLLNLENVVLTPHIGSADALTRGAMLQSAIDNVVEVLSNRPPLDLAT